ncbi:hypothetical protein ACU63X_01730 [Klebsiella aerogenes]|uniref:hypothetical protein n=1 Tax=Klebsiella aerogenes TaxID=548 RepID=UPI001C8B91B8|nr:hypothetical protein [Klebsiella aerogenes]EKZ2441576.1 hypothetical protein [Citrobacter freundii]MBX9064441.1 hypothetical protein [Klebsiella aerogenes]MDS1902543.1 hypothetical protein [Klebsiella aerogenes]MDS1932265.1 hypothetical protein [Klebsiella aerogenes]MDS2020080.1 hypothetical protein [Klebsiella aerogenes]
MKLLIVLALAFISVQVHAGKITLILSDEIETSDGKICLYENAVRSEQVKVAASAQCRHTMTFED